MNKKRINDIVDDNYIYASVLYYLGIEFYNYSDKTLEQVCTDKGLNVEAVINKLESANSKNDDYLKLNEYPIDLIVEYLKHTHYVFIKEKLPYIAHLIEKLEDKGGVLGTLEKDLQFVFPLFVEDFIHHIYQEEDSLFSYILLLNKFAGGKGNPSRIYFEIEKHSLQKHAVEHEEHDDEMRGIRKITNNYSFDENSPLHTRVIFSELQCLEKELITHARVENEILFPKALMLERQVKQLMHEKIQYN